MRKPCLRSNASCCLPANNDLELGSLQRLVKRLRDRIAFVEGSRFWRMRDAYVRARARLGSRPAEKEPAIPPRDYLEAMDVRDPYARWLGQTEPRASDLARMREMSSLIADAPVVAVIVDDRYGDAAATVASIEAQAYAATRVVRTSEYGSDPSDWVRFNAAFSACDADVVAFCDARCTLAPHAAFEIALAFARDAQLAAAYGDRDVLSPDGSRGAPEFAPDWSPETFLSYMYTGPVIFYRRSVVARAGGFRGGFGSALHYDLALRVFETTTAIAHRPAVIVHDAALEEGEAARARSDADLAVAAALERRGRGGRIATSEHAGVRIVRYPHAVRSRIDVIVPTRDQPELLDRCLRSVLACEATVDLRLIVVDNGSVEVQTAELLASYVHYMGERMRVLRVDRPFNFAELVNAGTRASDGSLLLFLNNDAQFVSADGISAMAEYACLAEIGAVGGRLLLGDGSLQHAGVVIGIGGFAGHVYRGVTPERARMLPAIAGVRNYSAVTAAALMLRRDAFVAVGGFDERLAVDFNDIDLCLKLGAAGFRNVYLPHVVLRHDESSSRGLPDRVSSRTLRERALFRERWRTDGYVDPYYNVHLTLETEDASIVL